MPKIVDHDARRQELVSAFWRVVDRDGIAVASVRTVAAEAGVSKTNIGHYFPAQPELLAAAVIAEEEQVVAGVMAVDLTKCTVDSASAALLKLLPDSAARRRRTAAYLQLLEASASAPQLQPHVLRVNGERNEAIRYVLSAMQARRLVHRGRNMADEIDALSALLWGLTVQSTVLRSGREASRDQQVLTQHLAQLSARPK